MLYNTKVTPIYAGVMSLQIHSHSFSCSLFLCHILVEHIKYYLVRFTLGVGHVRGDLTHLGKPFVFRIAFLKCLKLPLYYELY